MTILLVFTNDFFDTDQLFLFETASDCCLLVIFLDVRERSSEQDCVCHRCWTRLVSARVRLKTNRCSRHRSVVGSPISSTRRESHRCEQVRRESEAARGQGNPLLSEIPPMTFILHRIPVLFLSVWIFRIGMRPKQPSSHIYRFNTW